MTTRGCDSACTCWPAREASVASDTNRTLRRAIMAISLVPGAVHGAENQRQRISAEVTRSKLRLHAPSWGGMCCRVSASHRLGGVFLPMVTGSAGPSYGSAERFDHFCRLTSSRRNVNVG